MSEAVERGRDPNQLLRHRTRLPRLRLPHRRCSTPPSGVRPATRGSTSTTTTSAPKPRSRRAVRLSGPGTSGASRSCCRSPAGGPQTGSRQFAGQTPLIRAERLGAELGLRNLYVKDDSTNRPSLSYKDRVVGMAVARAARAGRDEIGCVSTGNVGTATASLGAKAGAHALHLLPGQPGAGKARGVPRARCPGLPARRQLRRGQPGLSRAGRSDRDRSSPTSACGRSTPRARRRSPSRWSRSSAGTPPTTSSCRPPAAPSPRASTRGCSSWRRVGLAETAATKLNIGQPTGCSPIATAIVEGRRRSCRRRRRRWRTRWRSAPPATAPLVVDAVRSRGGSAAPCPTARSSPRSTLLAATEGVLTEPAGGTTIAATMRLAQRGEIGPDDTVVVVISGNGLKTLSGAAGQALAGRRPLRRRRRWRKSCVDFREGGVTSRA